METLQFTETTHCIMHLHANRTDCQTYCVVCFL